LAKTQKKQRVVYWTQFAEIPIMIIAAFGFILSSVPIALVSIFLMGMQSALTSPSKFGLIRDIGGDDGISFGTGAMDMLLFIAVLSGTILASVIADNYNAWVVSFILIGIALAGWKTSSKIKAKETEPKRNGKYMVNPISYISYSFREASKIKFLNKIVFAIASFWLFGSLLQMNLIVHGPEYLELTNTVTGITLAAAATGIGLGCYVAGIVSKKKVALHLVPFGSIGMILGTILAYFSSSIVTFSIFIFLTAFFSGFFKVPLSAWIQSNVKGRLLGEILAYQNMMVYLFISLSAGIFWLTTHFFDTRIMFIVLSILASSKLIFAVFFIPPVKNTFINLFRKNQTNIKRVEVNVAGSIPQHFVKSFSTDSKLPFAFDTMHGQSTKKSFKQKAYVVAELIKKEVPDKHVGIMLPALQSTALLVAATYLAGKTPVMLNWTIGPKVLEECTNKAGLKKIITASKFLDKIKDKIADSTYSQCIQLDECVKQLTLKDKLKGVINGFRNKEYSSQEDDIAVILFTSGSESTPKAVPLTHKNILSNLGNAFKMVELYSDSKLLSFLPPFHSFGFTVLTILPLVTGVQVVYTPDPTNSKSILKIINETKANTLMATPTFCVCYRR
jgi:MFS family permease